MKIDTSSRLGSAACRLWQRPSLAERFALTGGVVMLLGMAATGSWVASRIEEGVTRNTANATALYVESVIAPLSQELTRPDGLSASAARALDEVLANTPLGRRVVSFKLWQRGGRIVYASNPDLAGQVFPPTDDLTAPGPARSSRTSMRWATTKTLRSVRPACLSSRFTARSGKCGRET
jgi:hypothetical protein